MIEGALGAEFRGFLVEGYDLYLVVVFFDEAAKSESESLVGSDGPVHTIERPGRLVLVDFFPLRRNVVQSHFWVLRFETVSKNLLVRNSRRLFRTQGCRVETRTNRWGFDCDRRSLAGVKDTQDSTTNCC